MENSKIISKNDIIIDVIFYPNNYLMNKALQNNMDNRCFYDFTIKGMETRTNYVWPLIREFKKMSFNTFSNWLLEERILELALIK